MMGKLTRTGWINLLIYIAIFLAFPFFIYKAWATNHYIIMSLLILIFIWLAGGLIWGQKIIDMLFEMQTKYNK